MKWQEVREFYPEQFVKFEILESHIQDNKEFVDEVAIIKAITKDKKVAIEHSPSYGLKEKVIIRGEEILREWESSKNKSLFLLDSNI